MSEWSRWGALVNLAQIPLFWVLAFVLGRFVELGRVEVGYARKILALVLYFAPLSIGLLSPLALYNGAGRMGSATIFVSVVISTLSMLVCLVVLVRPIRSRFHVAQTMFACIDRPEDRPHTLSWLVTSIVATALIIVLWVMAFPTFWQFALIALFVAGVGDAVAEPVGLRFGKNPYDVKALWTDRTYKRTLEGSLCVFVSGIVGVVLFLPWSAQLVLALLFIPAAATLAEAKSPHTWDQPFIVAACWGASLLTTLVP